MQSIVQSASEAVRSWAAATFKSESGQSGKSGRRYNVIADAVVARRTIIVSASLETDSSSPCCVYGVEAGFASPVSSGSIVRDAILGACDYSAKHGKPLHVTADLVHWDSVLRAVLA